MPDGEQVYQSFREQTKRHKIIDRQKWHTLIFHVTGQQNRVVLIGFYCRRIASKVAVRRSMRSCKKKQKRIQRKYNI